MRNTSTAQGFYYGGVETIDETMFCNRWQYKHENKKKQQNEFVRDFEKPIQKLLATENWNVQMWDFEVSEKCPGNHFGCPLELIWILWWIKNQKWTVYKVVVIFCSPQMHSNKTCCFSGKSQVQSTSKNICAELMAFPVLGIIARKWTSIPPQTPEFNFCS